MTATVLVLGATGNTGSAVVDELRRMPQVSVRTATRASSPPTDLEHRRFDWSDAASWHTALEGADRVYLVAPAGHPEPVSLVAPFLQQAVATGVRRVVMLSSSAVAFDGPNLGQVASAVRDAVPEWEILRPAWFMQNFTGTHPVAESIRTTGEFVTATGTGRVPFIDAGDIGRVAAHLLAAPKAKGAEHLLTGPVALTYDEAAAIVSEVTGRRVRHRAVATGHLTDVLTASGYDAAFADMLAALDTLIRDGAQEEVTDTVERLTGTPARTFAAFLRAQRLQRA